MTQETLARFVYTLLLAIMIISALWVGYDTRKRGLPLVETLVWGLFAGWFFGLGLIIYLYWRKKMPNPQTK